MYRDLIGDPERCTAGGRDWWVQVLCRWTGELDTVILYDDSGEPVREFNTLAECEAFLVGLGK